MSIKSINIVSGSNYYNQGNTEQIIQKAVSQDSRNYEGKVYKDVNQEDLPLDIGVDLPLDIGVDGRISFHAASDINRLNNAVEHVNGKLEFTQTKCEITYHKDIKRYAVKILDKNTDEIIREIPADETIKLIQKLWEFSGFIVDERR